MRGNSCVFCLSWGIEMSEHYDKKTIPLVKSGDVFQKKATVFIEYASPLTSEEVLKNGLTIMNKRRDRQASEMVYFKNGYVQDLEDLVERLKEEIKQLKEEIEILKVKRD